MGNSLRRLKNIFNSNKITINEKEFRDRKPFSKNTLGFDILQMELPNPDNELISNDVNQIVMKIKTKTDRFYLFFTAFQTEISHLNYIENKDKEQEVPVVITLDEDDIKIKEETTIEKDPELKDINEILESESYTIPSRRKGIYLVTNVFSIPENTVKWEHFLRTKGYTPKSFINPENNLEYVYVFYSEDINISYNRYLELASLDYFNNIWVSKVNLP